jgi:glycosyltransferase involved in cell wall biosynthesis
VSHTPPDISVVIPCLNEAENVGPISAAVAAELDRARVSWDITFIDNGSNDGTAELIKGLCAADRRIRLIVNTRNFGQMRSPTYAVYQTSGRAVIGLCADFQDPPTLIGEFIACWRAGARIVLGVRRSERMPFARRLIRAVGYAVFERFGDYRVIPDATGFGLYDREVVDCLKRWRDPEPFFRGMLVESGYRLETIAYDRPARAAGQEKNTFASLFSFGLSGLASSSKRLLRLPIYISLATFASTGLTILWTLIAAITGQKVSGLLLLSLAELGFSLVFLFLGLIGEQVRLISEMSRNVPLVIEKERVNFPDLRESSDVGSA